MSIAGGIINYVSITVLVALIPVVLSLFIVTVVNGSSPPMPSSRKALLVIKKIIEELSLRGPVVELGSGWGSLSFPIAREFPDINLRGYENSPVPYLFCAGMKFVYRCKNAGFVRRNFFRVSLREANAVICYLQPGAMKKLKPKLERELGAGCFVISNTFAVPGWKPLRTVEVNDVYRTKVYLYKIAASQGAAQ